MMMIRVLVVWMVLSAPLAFAAKVTLIVPDKQGPAFWSLVDQFTVAAADSLGVELDVVYGAENRFATLDIINTILARPSKPDYLIFRPFHGNSSKVFDRIEASEVAFVTLEQAFMGAEAQMLKKPQQKYKYWLGEVTYDNVKGGELLLNTLIAEHKVRHSSQQPSIIGMGGDFDNLSLKRQQALVALNPNNKAHVNQIFPTYWDPKNIAKNFEKMFGRYPHTNIFWCAGDQLALETYKQHQRMHGRPIVVGGFDWLPEVLDSIQQGHITASVGGHFLMGAIAVTKIFDYQHGLDRFSEIADTYDFEVITKNNVSSYIGFMNRQKWQEADFSQFSAVKMGKDVKKLTVGNIIAQLEQ